MVGAWSLSLTTLWGRDQGRVELYFFFSIRLHCFHRKNFNRACRGHFMHACANTRRYLPVSKTFCFLRILSFSTQRRMASNILHKSKDSINDWLAGWGNEQLLQLDNPTPGFDTGNQWIWLRRFLALVLNTEEHTCMRWQKTRLSYSRDHQHWNYAPSRNIGEMCARNSPLHLSRREAKTK